MKELIGSARNLYVSIPDGRPASPLVEVLLVLGQTDLTFDAAGQHHQTPVVKHCRFAASSEALRSLARRFDEFADEADALDVEDRTGEDAGPEPEGGAM